MAQALAEQANVVVSKFVDSLQEPRTPYISPTRFSAVLGVKVMALAELTGVHRNTLRNPSSERLQLKMREMIKVISAAAELTGDIQKASIGIEMSRSLTTTTGRRQNWLQTVMLMPSSPIFVISRTELAGENHSHWSRRRLP